MDAALRLMAVTLVMAGFAALPAAAPAQQPAPGFKAPLLGEGIAEPAQPECHVYKRVLECWFVGKLPRGASCSFGGTVPTVRLTRSGRARQTFVCMDEAFHGWKVLRPGRSWRSGVFRCAHRWRGSGVGRHTELRCSNGRRAFRVLPSGELRRS